MIDWKWNTNPEIAGQGEVLPNHRYGVEHAGTNTHNTNKHKVGNGRNDRAGHFPRERGQKRSQKRGLITSFSKENSEQSTVLLLQCNNVKITVRTTRAISSHPCPGAGAEDLYNLCRRLHPSIIDPHGSFSKGPSLPTRDSPFVSSLFHHCWRRFLNSGINSNMLSG